MSVRRQIMRVIEDVPGIEGKAIAARLGVNPGAIYPTLLHLAKDGKARRRKGPMGAYEYFPVNGRPAAPATSSLDLRTVKPAKDDAPKPPKPAPAPAQTPAAKSRKTNGADGEPKPPESSAEHRAAVATLDGSGPHLGLHGFTLFWRDMNAVLQQYRPVTEPRLSDPKFAAKLCEDLATLSAMLSPEACRTLEELAAWIRRHHG